MLGKEMVFRGKNRNHSILGLDSSSLVIVEWTQWSKRIARRGIETEQKFKNDQSIQCNDL